MPAHLLDYLSREHARLKDELIVQMARRSPDEVQISRLKKLKLIVKDMIVRAERKG